MSLVLGKNHVTREQIALCATPEINGRHVPIPHIMLIEETEKALLAAGFTIEEEDHVLARPCKENANMFLRYFGGFAITRTDLAGQERRIVLGLRNANDKGFAASVCIGNQMLVCENLCFSSEEKLARRHTTNIKRDLPNTIASAISRIVTRWSEMTDRIELYKSTELTEAEASKLAVHLVDCGSLPKQKLYDVVDLWRNPAQAAKGIVEQDDFLSTTVDEETGMFVDSLDEAAYAVALVVKEGQLEEEFGKAENLWGLYNAVTESLKGSDISKLPQRTMNLQSLFDATVDFSPVVGELLEEQEEGAEETFQETFREDAPFVSEPTDTEEFID
jgi:hypothetical protein